MGYLLEANLAEVEARCADHPDAAKACRFLVEWIDVSQELGLSPQYQDGVIKRIRGYYPQERLF